MSTPEGFHSLAEARSWALHGEVAARLPGSPEILLSAQQRVAGWLTRRAEHPYAAAWDDLLQLPLEPLCQALTDKGEHMCTLRQASPFAGAFDARARWSILKRPELRPRGSLAPVQDTDEASRRRYQELLRQAGPAQRLEMCARLTSASREMALAGLRHQHPEASPVELRRALAARLYGAEIANRLPLQR